MALTDINETVKSKQLCYQCFNTGHRVGDCTYPPCPIDNCGKKHNYVIHFKQAAMSHASMSCGNAEENKEKEEKAKSNQ